MKREIYTQGKKGGEIRQIGLVWRQIDRGKDNRRNPKKDGKIYKKKQ